MLFIGEFLLFRPDQGRPPHFSKMIYWDHVYNWDINTFSHAPKILDLKKEKYLVNDRLCCMCYYPKPGLFYLFKNTLIFVLASF